MPDFFLISGLFLSQVISRPWKNYLDTKVVHYLYFLVLWSLLIVPGTWLISGPMPDSGAEAIKVLAYSLYKPVAMLWFIMMLPIYFVVARLLKGVPNALVLAVAALMMVFPLPHGCLSAGLVRGVFHLLLCRARDGRAIFQIGRLGTC